MAGAKQRDPRKEARWRKHLRRQHVSGLSIRDFCQEHSLAESAFHYWRREIARRDREFGACGAPTLVPVTVLSEASAGVMEVVLTSGRVVRVTAGFDATMLRQLLTVLEEPSC